VIAAARPQAAISTPRARRVAGELGVNWPTLTGSGRGGRIREADVRAAAAVRQGDPASGVRSSAARGAAQVTLASLHTTADVSALVRLHGDLVAVDRLVGLRLCGFEDIILKFAAAALRRHPVLNSYWNGPNWVVSPDIHISLAVAMEDHFIHPVVHDADALSLRDLANRSRDLIARAHSRQLAEADLAGGTFTVCNLGAFGIDAFTPTPHPPQCAALGIGRVVRQPAGTGDAAPRDIITLSLTFDPRAFDAAPAARFLQTLAGLIESPLAALLSH
jgi:pyruvate dehydrogenase E2 component (dihydrolipoamide acetyltransferase)